MLFNKQLLLGIAAVGSMASVCGGASGDPFLPVPPASFLNYHVSTARGLSEEVAQDVVVRARLARHFGMSAPALAAYVRQNLVETELTAGQAGRYRVACISPSGREYFVSERLAAGTPVFALATTGQPILRLACGNPLVAVLPPVPPKPMVQPKPALLALSPKALPAAATPSSEITDQLFTQETPISSPEIDSVGSVSQVAGMTQSLGGGKGGLLFPVLFGAVGLGVLSGHHGSSPSGSPVTPGAPIVPTTPTTPVTPTNPIVPVVPTTPIIPTTPITPVTPTVPVTSVVAVPEPSPLVLFGIFGSVLVGLQLKARCRRR